jgi:hypothetical protein
MFKMLHRALCVEKVNANNRLFTSKPPQQHDWWATEAQQAAGLDKRLPSELVQLVVEQRDWLPISRAETERLREELRRDHERKRKAVEECVGHYLVSYLP